MEIESKIARYGNSLTVRLPVGIARELDLRDGDRVKLRTAKGGVFIERSGRSRLAERLASVVARESEIATGPPVGEEAID